MKQTNPVKDETATNVSTSVKACYLAPEDDSINPIFQVLPEDQFSSSGPGLLQFLQLHNIPNFLKTNSL